MRDPLEITPIDHLARARDLLALFRSVDWKDGGYFIGAENGADYLLDEVHKSISETMELLKDS